MLLPGGGCLLACYPDLVTSYAHHTHTLDRHPPKSASCLAAKASPHDRPESKHGVDECILICPTCRSALAKHLQEHKAANPPPDEQEAAKLPQWKKPVMTSLANLILRGLLKEHAHL